jgi:hypothetical protein
MTQERFLQILNDPTQLGGISYEELKTLTLAYPATHNLRVLLAIKAQQVDHPDFARQLASAAAYSLDRTHLFHLMAPAQLAPQAIAMGEEVLELKPIADIRKAIAVKVSVEKPAELPLKKTMDLDLVSTEPSRSETPPLTPAKTDNKPALTLSPVSLEAVPEDGGHWISISRLPVLQALQSTAPIKNDLPQERPKQIEKANRAMSSDAPKEPELPAAKENPGLSAQELAERSVHLREEVVSETLARLLAKQGYKDKAQAMYEKLRLLFPEKSDYFAAEIQKLKK